MINRLQRWIIAARQLDDSGRSMRQLSAILPNPADSYRLRIPEQERSVQIEGGISMFGYMKALPILTVGKSSVQEAVAALLTNTENAKPVRWIEFPTAIILLLTVPVDADSGAFYVFDRNT